MPLIITRTGSWFINSTIHGRGNVHHLAPQHHTLHARSDSPVWYAYVYRCGVSERESTQYKLTLMMMLMTTHIHTHTHLPVRPCAMLRSCCQSATLAPAPSFSQDDLLYLPPSRSLCSCVDCFFCSHIYQQTADIHHCSVGTWGALRKIGIRNKPIGFNVNERRIKQPPNSV
jgi:hypothetical protein